MDRVIEQTRAYVQQKLASESSGHDWWHIERVTGTALTLAAQEGADQVVVELAALLHDIADWKFHGGDELAGARVAREWLTSLDVDSAIIDQVCEIIATLSYKGAGVQTPMKTLEGMIVQDADRLDALGAVGIARTFAYGGHKNRLMHDPDQPPQMHQSFEQYKRSEGTTINHFYEKLLLLKERMNTQAAKNMAAQRHAFMEQFLNQFFAEWRGEK